MKEKQFDLTVLGEALIDFTSYGKSEQGMTLFEQNPGGAPANVVCAAAKLGLKTAFIGKVGCDMQGEFLKRILMEHYVNIDSLIMTDEAFTTLAFVELSESGERSFSFARNPGADTRLREEEVQQSVIERSEILHVGSLSLSDEPSRSATFLALKTAKECGKIISYDLNYRAKLWRDAEEAKYWIRSVLPYTDVIKLSEEELFLVSGLRGELDASCALLDMGISCVLLTLGAKGALVRVAEGCAHIEGVRANVVDTTGAGDAFVGGFLYRMSVDGVRPNELTLHLAAEYARFANTAAGICVGRRGAIPALPTLDEVEDERIHGY